MKPDYANIRGPVLGLFAEKDAYVDSDAVRALARSLEEAGVENELHTYPGVDHAFFNDERKEVYDETAAQDAWRRVKAFFGEHLR